MLQTFGVVFVKSKKMWEDDSKMCLGSRLAGLVGWTWFNVVYRDGLCKGRK